MELFEVSDGVLRLYNRPLNVNALLEVLKVDHNIHTLQLNATGLCEGDAATLAEELKVNQTLHSLHLSNNPIGDAGAAALAEALKVNTTVHTLDLYNSIVGDVGAAALVEVLKVNTTLHTLDLGYNQIGDMAALALAEALKVNTTLHTLILSHHRYTQVGIKPLIEALQHHNASLEELHGLYSIGYNLLHRNRQGKICARESAAATYKVLRLHLRMPRDICRLLSQYVAESRGHVCWIQTTL